MRQIGSYFYDSPEAPLYHYTGIASLEGIANYRSLWASNIYYLNDSKELLHACEILDGVLEEPGFVFGPKDKPRNRFIRDLRLWATNLSHKPNNLFVFSLSAERSLLSQWRSYTPHGKGVSIGFSTGLVREIAWNNNMRLGKCLYDYPSQEALISSLVESLWTTACQRPELPALECVYFPFFEEFRIQILQVLALIKHDAFSEEQEWRLISSVLEDGNAKICYRPGEGASLLVPYIKVDIGNADNLFDLIILGPTPHEMLAEHALAGFIKATKICRGLEVSGIPFRKW